MGKRAYQVPESLFPSLEQESNRNLVLFYADELRKILARTNPKNIPSLSPGLRKRFHDHGLLEHDPYRGNGFKLSRRALEILQEASK